MLKYGDKSFYTIIRLLNYFICIYEILDNYLFYF